MDIISVLTGRILAILIGAWMGLSTAFFAAFLWHGFKKQWKRTPRPGPAVADCPYCKGTGSVRDAFDDWAVCPLCDGDRELTAPLELDEG